MHTRFGSPVVSVEQVGARWDVLLPGGVAIEADAVVTGLGAKPNTEWLDGSGLDITDGVLTNERRQAVTVGGTVTGNVVAVGDVARTPSPLTGGRVMRWEHWTAATNDARCAAAALTGREPRPEAPAVFWTDVYHHRIQGHRPATRHGIRTRTRSPWVLCELPQWRGPPRCCRSELAAAATRAAAGDREVGSNDMKELWRTSRSKDVSGWLITAEAAVRVCCGVVLPLIEADTRRGGRRLSVRTALSASITPPCAKRG